MSQLKADRRLIDMGPHKFAERCQRYDVGRPGGQADRPHGRWVIILDPDFVADLPLCFIEDDDFLLHGDSECSGATEGSAKSV
jgi:hypothetical protein